MNSIGLSGHILTQYKGYKHGIEIDKNEYGNTIIRLWNNGKLNGYVIVIDEYNNKISECNYVNGVRNGNSIEYKDQDNIYIKRYINGEIICIGKYKKTYIDDKLEKVKIVWEYKSRYQKVLIKKSKKLCIYTRINNIIYIKRYITQDFKYISINKQIDISNEEKLENFDININDIF